MLPQLPDDILCLICEQLFACQDFSTLFSCVASCSKDLSPPAAAALYRMHSSSSHDDEESEGLHGAAQQQLMVQKWMITWRSIILSCFEKTVLPYYHYLRYLDLRDLRNLLEDPKFPGRVEKVFFQGIVSKFQLKTSTKRNVRSGKAIIVHRLDVSAAVEAIGDVITSKAVLLESVSGDFSSTALLRWVPSLKRLQRLELWDGESLGDEQVHKAIRSHCLNFRHLSIFHWRNNPRSDALLGKFIAGLPENSLETFITINDCGVSESSSRALNRHGGSLYELALSSSYSGVAALAHLHNCTSIQKLKIETDSSLNLQVRQNDVFTELIEWLRNCSKLRDVDFENLSAPAVLEAVFKNSQISLQDLCVSNYSMRDNQKFHKALETQPSLRTLCLTGDADDGVVGGEDTNALVDSLCTLKELRYLKLVGVSDYFALEHYVVLLSSVQSLDTLYSGGLYVTDDFLDVVANHTSLRSVSFSGISAFTYEALLAFVESLGSDRTGFELNVANAEPLNHLTEEKVSEVRKVLYERCGGRFEYILYRDPDISEFEGSDSD